MEVSFHVTHPYPFPQRDNTAPLSQTGLRGSTLTFSQIREAT